VVSVSIRYYTAIWENLDTERRSDDRSPTEVYAYHESLKKAFSSSRPPTIEATNLPTTESAAVEHVSDGKEKPDTQEPAEEQLRESTANPVEGSAK
jgi:hypothetical protein